MYEWNPTEGPVSALWASEGVLYVCSGSGVQAWDIGSQGQLVHYEHGHQKRITGCVVAKASLYTCSEDGTSRQSSTKPALHLESKRNPG